VPSVGQVLEMVRASIAALRAVDLGAEPDRELLDAAVELQALVDQLVGQQLRVLETVDRREAFAHHGALATTQWYRNRTRLTHGAAAGLVRAAQRLRRLPQLRTALEAGDIGYAHVAAIAKAASPRRMPALEALEVTLVELARHGTARDVTVAVRRIAEQVDRDGTDVDELSDDGPDERRELSLHRGIDGLGELRATLDRLDCEALATLLDAWHEPDPPDTPPERRRTAGQRRADAFSAMLQALLACDDTPTVEGYRAQILAVVDLLSLLGLDRLASEAQVSDDQVAAISALADVDADTARRIAAEAVRRARTAGADPAGGSATSEPDTPAQHLDVPGLGQPIREPRLRHTGATSMREIRRLADCAKVQVLLTLGPWRGVSVARTQRRLPPWLRTALAGIHGHCRGPDCDRPVSWADAHHVDAWVDDGHTDLNRMVPVCRRHHQKVTVGGWTMDYDCDRGVCTWTGPAGQTVTTPPLPP